MRSSNIFWQPGNPERRFGKQKISAALCLGQEVGEHFFLLLCIHHPIFIGKGL
jgi:hypothetical protein